MADIRIQGKVALVTGGAVGTGCAMAERLAAAGAEVVVADIAEAAWTRTVSVRFVRVDMTDDAAVTELMGMSTADPGQPTTAWTVASYCLSAMRSRASELTIAWKVPVRFLVRGPVRLTTFLHDTPIGSRDARSC